jgi:hypothetical protein
MKKAILLAAIVLTGCETLPEPICYGQAMIGGQETTVPIYDVKKVGNYTQYRAGAVYSWRYVGVGAFSKTDCPAP